MTSRGGVEQQFVPAEQVPEMIRQGAKASAERRKAGVERRADMPVGPARVTGKITEVTAPVKVTPNPSAEITAVANDYNKAHGLPPMEHKPFEVNENLSRKIAAFYDKAEHQPNDPAVQAAYKTFNAETHAQFEHLVKAGYKFTPTENDTPYMNSAEVRDDLAKNKHLSVYNGGEPHELMTPQQNFEFRAVHDTLAEGGAGAEFGHGGEELAYRTHMQMYTPEAQKVAVTETRGQNAAVHFSSKLNNPVDYTYTDKLDRPFSYPQQKATILPEEARHPEGKVRPAGTNALLSKEYAKQIEPGMLTRSGFMDDHGNPIQINGDHFEALKQAGLAPNDSTNSNNILMPHILAKHGLVRLYVDRNSFQPNITLEVGHKPSPELMHSIEMLSRANPRAGVVFDLYDKGQHIKSLEGGNTLEAFKRAVADAYGKSK